MENTLVTVIIPTYRRLDYLAQAVQSVCEQTYHHFECLIINDYPQDSEALTDKIASFKDDRLRLINRSTTGGGNAARNTGIQQARGSIIAFLDDDDCWLPHKLERHLEHHAATEVGLVFSGLIKRWSADVIPSHLVKGRLPPEGAIAAMRRGKFCPLTTSAVTVRRACFDHCGLFDVELVSFQDWDMWYRLAGEYDFAYIEEPLLVFRQHLGDRTSKTKERRFLGLKQLVNKWQLDLDDPQQFEAIFIKDTYTNLVYDAILRAHSLAAIRDWYTLLKLSRTTADFIQLAKLIVMLAIGAKQYGRIFKSEP
ncbi:MAG: glycosyltransferase family 2 protein [Cyanobacteria bacterium J06623_7]